MTLAKIIEALLPSRTMRRRAWPIVLGLGYIFIIYALGGLKARHVMMGLLGLLDAYNERSRLFLKYFFPFMFTGILYDSMRYYYWWGIEGHVHVIEPYQIEKNLFGIQLDGKIVTVNELFEKYTFKILDFFCGFAYLTFVMEYLGAAFLLFFAGRLQLLRALGWTFLLVNVMGFATYYIYPAAPPWYITQHGLGPALMHISGTASAAGRFDQLLGTHFFDSMYSQSVDVYGAIPSLHVAYPLLVAWSALVMRRFRTPAIAFYFLMCFSAVYLQHHFIIDIILGTLYTICALLLVRYVQDYRELATIPWNQRLVRLVWPAACFSEEQGEVTHVANSLGSARTCAGAGHDAG